jgi:uncharacterized RDD family membrane protein YckC
MQDSLYPATFLQRLGAAIVDFFVVAVYVYAVGWFCSTSKPLAQVLILPLGLGAFAYPLVTHARYGSTLGKWLVGIRVAQLSGSPIGWNESLRRSAVDGLFQVAWTVGLFAALLMLPDESFSSQGWLRLHNELQSWLPSFVPSILIASTIWSWSEMLTMLFNRRRRAIHDFIASTIVIRGGA